MTLTAAFTLYGMPLSVIALAYLAVRWHERAARREAQWLSGRAAREAPARAAESRH